MQLFHTGVIEVCTLQIRYFKEMDAVSKIN